MATGRNKLFELAKENGYSLKRTKGGHKIYEDKNGNILVIPFNSTEVTTGMAKKIERDIRNNKNRRF